MKNIILCMLFAISIMFFAGCEKQELVIDETPRPVSHNDSLPDGAILHPTFGYIMKNEIMMIFKSGVSEEERQAIVEGIPAKYVSDSRGKRFVIQKETTPEEFERIIDELNENEFVEVAVPNEIMSPN